MRPWKLLLICSLMLAATLLLAGCEKERPLPAGSTPATPARGLSGTLTPGAPVVQVGVTVQPGRATPMPLNAPSPTFTPPGGAAAAGGQAAAAGGAFVYKVAPGDTLLGIANRFGVKSTDIVKLNGLTNPDALVLGQQ